MLDLHVGVHFYLENQEDPAPNTFGENIWKQFNKLVLNNLETQNGNLKTKTILYHS